MVTNRIPSELAPETLLPPPGQFRRAPSGPSGHAAGRDELRFHRASEGVALQSLSGDRLVREPQLSQCELVAEQPVGVRLVKVVTRSLVGVVRSAPGRRGARRDWRGAEIRSG